MDVVAAVSERLGVDPGKATAVLGAVLGAARAQVPEAESNHLDAKIPELGGWIAAAGRQVGGLGDPAPPPPATDAAATEPASSVGGLLGGLLHAAGSGIGNELLGAVAGKQAQQTAAAAALLDGLGLSAEHAAMVAPVILDFLRVRLGADWTDRIVGAAPLLSGWLAPAPAGGASPLDSLLSMVRPK